MKRDDNQEGISIIDMATEMCKSKETIAKWCEDMKIEPSKGKLNKRFITYVQADMVRAYVPKKAGYTPFVQNKAHGDVNYKRGLPTRIMEDYVIPMRLQ